MELEKPYWVTASDELPFYDFNRELVAPGVNDQVPDGAVGIRVDDDFWTVAILPWRYQEVSIRDIVKELWPSIYFKATFGPDSKLGSQDSRS